MRKLLMLMAAAVILCSAAPDKFVKVSSRGEFTLGDSVYRFVGANMWYAPILASPSPAGDSARLSRELDRLKDLGVDNIRVMAGADAPGDAPHHVSPVLQTAPGVYSEAQLAGLDRLLAELEKRDMKAVIYLNNAWEWSGGYGSYLEWAGCGRAPVPGIDGYRNYVEHVKQFVLLPEAVDMAVAHARNIAGRVNGVTGRPYAESPAIMAWQVCNEPRAFSEEGKDALLEYIERSSRAIREVDPNHLISTGSEGKYGCEVDIDLWCRIHALPTIDYAVIHIWPFNWRWVTEPELTSGAQRAVKCAMEYLQEHIDSVARLKKPLVVEEFGYPRTAQSLVPGDDAAGRDAFYSAICSLVPQGKVAGVNFWGWGGEVVPESERWSAGAPYVTDPAHEPQGWYSVFDADSTTVDIISRAARQCRVQIR